eukprot:TRINITY_DN33452_c0_g1_i1.p1 TRINITY_DN33452_c0_g1~~TRINITY_DN33452_c0_g1_i1.p1  ORF type:complete len:834 (+),score=106.29 TRINITY_DN33452_c0_g1_i1:82-2583(+)
MGISRRRVSPLARAHSEGAPPVTDDGPLVLSRLSHAVVASRVEERLRVRLGDIQLWPNIPTAVTSLLCKVYIGPAAAVRDGGIGKINKARFRIWNLDFHQDGTVDTELPVGVVSPEEPWVIRLKLYTRSSHSLFMQGKVAEVVQALPLPLQTVELVEPTLGGSRGKALLEVVRLVPQSAMAALQDRFGAILCQAVHADATAEEVQRMCDGAGELGEDALLSGASESALAAASSAGKAFVVLRLLDCGVPPTMAAAQAAEKAGHLAIARSILLRLESRAGPTQLVARALEYGLPKLADRLLEETPAAIDAMSFHGGTAAFTAYAVGAWSVLAALLNRGDAMPVPAVMLLNHALTAGHVALARACLSRCGALPDLDRVLQTCLDNHHLEIMREVLESQWRICTTISSFEDTPSILPLECFRSDDLADCSVCFEPLYKKAGVLLNKQGFRVCQHFICEECAQHIQDEATNRRNSWTSSSLQRTLAPPGPACPICRAPFALSARLPDPTVDPRNFFRLACVGGPTAKQRSVKNLLTETAALGALCALLPISATAFASHLKHHLWPAWCGAGDTLTEASFLRPCGMLRWLSDHLFELKVEEQLGVPPSLHEARAWFEHFDYHGRGRLTQTAILRGVAIACLPSPNMLDSRTFEKVRSLVEGFWDDCRWADGVPLSDFEGQCGLAARLSAALSSISEEYGSKMSQATVNGSKRSVDEALTKARTSDFQTLRAEEIRWGLPAAVARKAPTISASPPAQRRSGRAVDDTSHVLHSHRLNISTMVESGTGHASDVNRHGATCRARCGSCGVVIPCRRRMGHVITCGNCGRVLSIPHITMIDM